MCASIRTMTKRAHSSEWWRHQGGGGEHSRGGAARGTCASRRGQGDLSGCAAAAVAAGAVVGGPGGRLQSRRLAGNAGQVLAGAPPRHGPQASHAVLQQRQPHLWRHSLLAQL